MTTEDNDLLIQYLRQEGYSEQEIERVLEKLNEHEDRTMRESVFDSIAQGTFNLKAMIKELLDED